MHSLAEVLPHAAPMILLDRIVGYDAERLTAELTVPAEGLFNDPEHGGVPAWVGIEYMAQAVAALDGCLRRDAGLPPKIGFLLGTRQYACAVPVFRPGQVLSVNVVEAIRGENGMAVYEARIECETAVFATAKINGFQPADPQAFLAGQQEEQ
ncbi:ApeP family dehydratase [Chitinilyticum litopenaei]|uniref:ApeP family dehydratase n=1 Tax=Chitinilyticum litopenaei TaxID=1121276 RepID=UPI00040EDE15|nr:hotdog family protein [Chitinilyticum litopenaei]